MVAIAEVSTIISEDRVRYRGRSLTKMAVLDATTGLGDEQEFLDRGLTAANAEELPPMKAAK